MAFAFKEGTAQRTAFGLAVLSTATQIALAAIITHLAITTPNSIPVFAATLAAVVFGHRPSEQEVVDLRRNEGRIAALVPTLLRTHPHPHRRGAARPRQHRTSS